MELLKLKFDVKFDDKKLKSAVKREEKRTIEKQRIEMICKNCGKKFFIPSSVKICPNCRKPFA